MGNGCTAGKREERGHLIRNSSLDIKYQSLKHPITTSSDVIRAPPSPHFLSNHVFWRERVAGAGRLQWGERDRRGREPNREREKQGRRGSERYSSERSKARQIQWRNPPSSQMNITTSLPPSCFTVVFFPLLPFSLLYNSSVRWESPAHGSSCSIRTTKPVGSPPLLATSSSFSSICPSIYSCIPPQAWRVKTGLFLLLRGRVSHHQAALLAAEKGNTRQEKKGYCCPFWRWKNLVCLPPFFAIGLQFWLCVGTKKRGPKCLKQITCCRCLGVTLRCVALIYVACRDNIWISLYRFAVLLLKFSILIIILWSIWDNCASLIAPKYISIMMRGVWQNGVCGSGSILSPLQSSVCLYVWVGLYVCARACISLS